MTDPLVLLTPKQLVDRLPWLTMRSLRWALQHADTNGLSAAIVRPSPRRILIDLDAFGEWLESKRQSKED